jgi:hypothetical protein
MMILRGSIGISSCKGVELVENLLNLLESPQRRWRRCVRRKEM